MSKISTLTTILAASACFTATPAHAAIIEFNGTNAFQFEQAVRNAGPGGTVNMNRNLVAARRIVISTNNVTINGRDNTIIENTANQRGIMTINANGVNLRNIIFSSQPAVIPFRAAVAPGPFTTDIRNCVFRNGNAGLRRLGDSFNGMTVANCNFNTTQTGISFNRDITAILPSQGQQARLDRARTGGRFVFQGNSFFGNHRVGITIDAGNDGFPGFANNLELNPGLTTPDFPIRRPVSNVITNFTNGAAFFNRSLIAGNTISGNRKFGIAIARSQGFIIRNNTITMAGSESFRRGLHFENRANSIFIQNNTINSNRGGHAVGLAAFSDYGNPKTLAFGNRSITIDGNRMTGAGNSVAGFGFRGIIIRNNTVNASSPTGDVYSFFNISGGANQFTAFGNRRNGVIRNPLNYGNGGFK